MEFNFRKPDRLDIRYSNILDLIPLDSGLCVYVRRDCLFFSPLCCALCLRGRGRETEPHLTHTCTHVHMHKLTWTFMDNIVICVLLLLICVGEMFVVFVGGHGMVWYRADAITRPRTLAFLNFVYIANIYCQYIWMSFRLFLC